MALYPSLGNGRINPALEIAVSDFEELVAAQYPTHGDFVICEHREDLPRRVVTRTHDGPPVVMTGGEPYAMRHELEVAGRFIPDDIENL